MTLVSMAFVSPAGQMKPIQRPAMTAAIQIANDSAAMSLIDQGALPSESARRQGDAIRSSTTLAMPATSKQPHLGQKGRVGDVFARPDGEEQHASEDREYGTGRCSPGKKWPEQLERSAFE